MFKDTMKNVDINNNTPAIVYTLLNNLKVACAKNSIVQVNHLDERDDNDEIYTILFKIFNSNGATADHLVAVSNGGDGEKDNLIGLCKTCNKTIKGKKQVFSWMVQNKSVYPNLLKQLRVINKMAKKGKIEGYDTWAKDVSQAIYDLSYNKFDMRKEFE
jgi:spore coat protein CotF